MPVALAVEHGELLASLRRRVDQELESILALPAKGPLTPALRYAVLGPGARLRPLLAMGAARVADADDGLSFRAAAAVELMHCASLVLDDLPCMDDEAFRRGQPATHRTFGEPAAVLASLSLLSLAARCIFEVHCPARFAAARLGFQLELLRAVDDHGLIDGQALDIGSFGRPHIVSRDEINELKTVPLFRTAVRAPLFFADFSEPLLAGITAFGGHAGRAYQLLDDLLDGEEADRRGFEREIGLARKCLHEMPGDTSVLHAVIDLLHVKADSHSHR